MISWTGRRKALTVLAFIAPTLLGLLVFNIYPILFNTYISVTNRNQFHPNPDCSVTLTSLLEPTCWEVFKRGAPTGLGTPFRPQDPIYENYTDLLSGLADANAFWALLRLLLCFAPLAVAGRVNARLDRQISRSIASGWVWLGGLAGLFALAALLDAGGAYDTITKSGDFLVVMFRTLLYVIACVPVFFGVALLLALILDNAHIRFKAIFRVIMIIPWAASNVAIIMSLVWQFFFREQGTINQVLAQVGIKGPTYLNDPNWAFVAIVLVQVWYTYPFMMTVILGALQAIAPEQYEAAEVDGASYWDRLTHITLPLIRPAVLPAVVLSSITTFQMFGTVWAMTGGGPTRGAGTPGATELVMVYAYKQVFQTQSYGRMGAFAVVMFVLLFAATLYSLRVTQITKGAYE
ncbi:MAG: sugar ABC transporter permease [Chloroflexi bacterium]|nr:sugar ABC transporter permease [Chloroflexota bacterium]